MLGLTKSNSNHTDLQSTRIVQGETDFKSLVLMLQSHWLDPFSSVQKDLVCLSTGKVASSKIQQHLLAAKAVGEKAYEIFRIEQLESQRAKTKFLDTIPKAKLQTFTDLNKKVQVKSKTSKEIILKKLINCRKPKASNERSSKSSTRPLPWVFSTVDGSLRKTNKAALAKELQKSVSFANVIPQTISMYDR